MIELTLIVFGLSLLFVALYLEVADRSLGRMPAAELARRSVGSRWPNLVIYSTVVVFLLSGLFVWLLQFQFYSGLPFLAMFGIIVMILTVAGVNQYRFDTVTVSDKEKAEIYFEAIEGMDPEVGIDYIIEYIQNPKWGAPQEEIEIFLRQIAKRQDEYGEVARKRLAELNLFPRDRAGP